MIDEWFEEKIDRLCQWAPAYLNPRITRFCATGLGWRLTLYAEGFRRRVWGALSNIQWIEKEEPKEENEPPQQEADPGLDKLDPAVRKDVETWNEENRAWEEKQQKERKKWWTPKRWFLEWWNGRHERARKSDERWARREAAAQKRAQAHMRHMLPLMQAVQASRFAVMLLMTALGALGVCAKGGGMGYMAAACCAMWLAVAFETGYTPVARGVRQRYLAALGLRAASFLLVLPMYFERYVRQGVTSNVVLQSAMLILLFAHAAFYLALVAFNRRQPVFLRLLSGLLGVIPALTAAAAVALAASQAAMPMPYPVAGAVGAAGAVLAFCADRLHTITDLGGIRLRYTPIWVGGFMEAGFLMMILGAWIA